MPTLERSTTEEKRSYERRLGILKVPGELELNLNYYYYRSTVLPKGFRSPVLFIYSGIDGITALEHHLGKYFTQRGISVVVSDYIDHDHIYDIDNYLLAMINTMRASFALTDYFASLPEVDANRLGILGISYGGIRGLYHTATDARIKAAVLIVTGTPIEEVIVKSQLDFVKKIRKAHMEKAGITTIQEYQELLQQQALLDIKDVVCRRKTDEFFLLMSKNDHSVPTAQQWNLWHTLGRPKHHTFHLGHIGVPIWAALFKKNSAHKFLKQHWKW